MTVPTPAAARLAAILDAALCGGYCKACQRFLDGMTTTPGHRADCWLAPALRDLDPEAAGLLAELRWHRQHCTPPDDREHGRVL